MTRFSHEKSRHGWLPLHPSTLCVSMTEGLAVFKSGVTSLVRFLDRTLARAGLGPWDSQWPRARRFQLVALPVSTRDRHAVHLRARFQVVRI
jgi:hypothetical protein